MEELHRPPAKGRSRHRAVGTAPQRCLLRLASCPFRELCQSDAQRFARAREGSRADFDALFDDYFPRIHAAARARLSDPALAEACTRELLEAAFCSASPARSCAGQMLRMVKARLSPRSATRAARAARVAKTQRL
ncbi:MAG TPA: hypothetical protein VFT98_18315 [Myxococcota bacterium]|nr:hypothetical protein [Myxococcota bacterium]